MTEKHSPAAQALRILPLIASATEIVHALGLGQFQVGRSHECDHPADMQSLPICTRPAFPVDGNSAEIDHLVKERLVQAAAIYDVDAELIGKLQPTHIITQTQCEVCAVSLADVERALRSLTGTQAKVIVCEPHNLSDIFDDIQRVAAGCDCPDAGHELVARLRGQINTLSTAAQRSTSQPRVAAIEWLEPLMSAGNWVPELIHLAGGINLFGEAGKHSPWMTWDELIAADPDVLIVMPCGFDIHRTRDEMHWLTSRSEWPALSAVERHQVFLCDGNQFFNRPGPRIVESLQILTEILHPRLFPPKLEGPGWVNFRP